MPRCRARAGSDRRCWQQGDANPILSIHDVGAGGLFECVARACPWRGRRRRVRPARGAVGRAGMAPREIWCNERRSATCWRSVPKTCRGSARCANASAAVRRRRPRRAPSGWSSMIRTSTIIRSTFRRCHSRQAAANVPRCSPSPPQLPPLDLAGVTSRRRVARAAVPP